MNLKKNIFFWSSLNKEEKYKVLVRPVYKKKKVVSDSVYSIINSVKKFKDDSLYYYTKIFDKKKIKDFRISKKKIQNSNFLVSSEIKKSIFLAKKNIEKFHKLQVYENIDVEIQKGIRCQKIFLPIEKIGLYIPGGSAPLISTVLMLAIPARIAKCKNIILCSPPSISNEILYAAHICGIKKIYSVGGAQAIAAMAYGTNIIPKVHKIFGPGNAYVTEAKRQVNNVYNGTSIDMLAGPSELVVIADNNANANFISFDLLSQAEHGPDSQVLLLTSSISLLENVIKNIEINIQKSKRKDIIYASLKKSRFILAKNILECVEISNIYSPEHLIINTKNPRTLLEKIKNAGSVFLGPWSPESAGDYASGTNHVLPTGGYSRSISGLGVNDFKKSISVQELTRQGLQSISDTVQTLSFFEDLQEHKNSISVRMQSEKETIY
ncbi:histidinol dehydrogenase [Buchnera aphidicola (Kurisakia onigurumii)]|uniref:histidinol dehydrogenase n=1 Tax=Buchnera aphidicola TaxID=9 RepID=UPI0031B68333